MSAKFIYTLSDESPDLRKQIGCMNGIFQLFDRRNFLGGGRRINGQNHKRVPQPTGQSANHEIEPKSSSQKTAEKSHKKSVKEKHRNSTESSRTSFSSSSCSSSLTSMEPNSTAQTIVPETHAWESNIYKPNAFNSNQQPLDLRDVVKDSIYREARGLLIKTGEAYGPPLKYIDSPRPLHLKSVDSKASGIKESFRVLHKLREAPQKSGERKHDLFSSAVKDNPRFSCDGRESSATLKSTIKLKELPRLSLDSRAGSTRRSATKTKPSCLLRDPEIGKGNSNHFLNQQEEPGSNRRPSSVVARLMGLEALPDAMSTNGNQTTQIKTNPDRELKTYAGLSGALEETKQKQFSGSPRNKPKEPISPRMTNAYSTKKPTASSKFPMEPAPWKQLDGSQSAQTPAFKSRVTTTKQSNSSLSVYGEIEKRLAQLEFKRSGKDLRALKQIIEAMQKTKDEIDTTSEASNYSNKTSSNSSLHQSTQFANLQNPNNNSHVSAPHNRKSLPKSSKSPIVIMKPAKLVAKASNSASQAKPTDTLPGLHKVQTGESTDGRNEFVNKKTAKDTTPRTNLGANSGQSLRLTDKNCSTRTLRLAQTSKEPNSTAKRDNSCKSSQTMSQRPQQKKLVPDMQSHATNSPSDSYRTRRVTSSGSPRGKPRAKSSKLQPSDDELSDVSTELRDLNHQCDVISMQSESNISLASQVDDEVSSTDRSNKTNSPFIQQAHQKQKIPVDRSARDRSIAEQPSPVSVLDATFYSEELPSPIKKISIDFKAADDEAITSDEMGWNHVNANLPTCSTDSCLNTVIDHKNAEVLQFLVQNAMQLFSAHDETTSHEIIPLYKSTNPDHRYISEILLVCDLLGGFESDFTTIPFPQIGYPINSNFFLALEHAKVSTKDSDDDHSRSSVQSESHIRSRRKLIFDLVNEILAYRLLLESSAMQGISLNLQQGNRPRGKQLLEELCSEVDRLQGNYSNCSLDEDDNLNSILSADLTHQSSHWTTFHSEIPSLVLDVERLIFKDLITEVVIGEANATQGRLAGHCRQLF